MSVLQGLPIALTHWVPLTVLAARKFAEEGEEDIQGWSEVMEPTAAKHTPAWHSLAEQSQEPATRCLFPTAMKQGPVGPLQDRTLCVSCLSFVEKLQPPRPILSSKEQIDQGNEKYRNKGKTVSKTK